MYLHQAPDCLLCPNDYAVRLDTGNFRSRLTVEQAAQRIGISPDRYRAVVVLGKGRFTEDEIQQVLFVTGISEDQLRVWEQRSRGDTRNQPAR